MTLKKTKQKRKTFKNKTKKITFCIKRNFIKNIIHEWKKQTNGCIQKDKNKFYLNDYYLSITKECDYNNHIHLALKSFSKNKNTYNNILYVIKKMDKHNIIIHSNEIKISIFSHPKKVVENMIQNYTEFNS